MPNAVIEDWDQFNAFLASQPLCLWLAQKQQDTATGLHAGQRHSSVHPPAKDDNADLVAALSLMA